MDGHTATEISVQRVSLPLARMEISTIGPHPGRKELSPRPSLLEFETTSSNAHTLQHLLKSPPTWLRTQAGYVSFASLGRSGRRESLFRIADTQN